MTHDDEKNAKSSIPSKDSAAVKAKDTSQGRRELSDDEIASVAGGLNPQPLPPGRSKMMS